MKTDPTHCGAAITCLPDVAGDKQVTTLGPNQVEQHEIATAQSVRGEQQEKKRKQESVALFSGPSSLSTSTAASL